MFIFRWKTTSAAGPGRLREMGLGSTLSVSLAAAREEAAKVRELLGKRIDPIEARKQALAVPSFGELADALIENRGHEGVADKSLARLKRSLEQYAAPLRNLRADQVDTNAVLAVLKPIWTDKPATAEKVQSHIAAVLDAAKARGFRHGDNPARWKGHLDQLLPRRNPLGRRHHGALPYAELPAFFAKLAAKGGAGALALQFTILTAARSGETFGAVWPEIDLERKVWTIPAGRMKEKREHRVPLVASVIDILEKAKGGSKESVFANATGGPLSSATMTKVLRDLGVGEVTVHGFRSCFRDWAGDASDAPREVAEAALSHAVGDQTERAYRRGDALERRRRLMQDWADYCLSAAER